MPDITVMGWNLWNIGDTRLRANAGGVELIQLIAAVVQTNHADIVGFSEVRSNRADDIGRDVTAILGPSWRYNAGSPAFGARRKEQYSFLWDSAKVTNYAPNFLHDFVNPDPVPRTALLGFPRQKAHDRPPLLGYFRTVLGAKNVLVAIMHSPEPGYRVGPRDAARNLAKAAELRPAVGVHACVLLGDFNVKANVGWDQGGPGEDAFDDLVSTANFVQSVPGDSQSSLIDQGWVGMESDDGKSQPYDQIFCWNAAGSGITFSDEGVEDLLVEIVPAGVPNLSRPSAAGNYLAPLLAAIDARINNLAPAPVYASVDQAFQRFRDHVSDHLPIVVKVNW